MLILLTFETESVLLSTPHIIPLSVMFVAFEITPPEIAEVELILVAALVVTTGGFVNSEFFLQPVISPNTLIKVAIVKIFINLIVKYFII